MLHSYPWYFLSWRGSRTRLKLSLEARGLFREVLDLMYEDGGVPANNDDELRRLTGATQREWKRSWPSVKALLAATDQDTLTHRKVQEILPDLLGLAAKRRRSSVTAANARWSRHDERVSSAAGINGPMPGAMRHASVGQCVNDAIECAALPLPYLTTTTTAETAPNGAGELELSNETEPDRAQATNWRTDTFERFWSIVWLKVGRGDAQKAFRKAASSPALAEQIIESARIQGPGLLADAERQQRSVLHPATWLNGRRWEDEPTAASANGKVRLDPGDIPENRQDWMRGAAE